MKLGLIGEEMVATAVKLAQERGSDVEALHVVRMPLSKSLDAPADPAEEERAVESLEEARLLGEDHGVVVRGTTVRARSIGEAIVRAGDGAGRRPHRARLGAALAPSVPLLLAHRRARPAQRAVRGARRRLPGARARKRMANLRR